MSGASRLLLEVPSVPVSGHSTEAKSDNLLSAGIIAGHEVAQSTSEKCNVLDHALA